MATEEKTSVIDRDVALKDINDWLDYKKFPQESRESEDYEVSIKSLVAAIMNGSLVVMDDKKLKYKLAFPIGKETTVDELVFKARMNDNMLKPWMKGVSPKDAEGRMLAHVACLTSTASSILEHMDTVDKRVAMSIAVFFV